MVLINALFSATNDALYYALCACYHIYDRKSVSSREIGCYFYLKGVIILKEFKVKVGLNEDDRVITIEPVNKAVGKTVETETMTARLLSQDDIDNEMKDLMEEGRTYRRQGRRIRETR